MSDVLAAPAVQTPPLAPLPGDSTAPSGDHPGVGQHAAAKAGHAATYGNVGGAHPQADATGVGWTDKDNGSNDFGPGTIAGTITADSDTSDNSYSR